MISPLKIIFIAVVCSLLFSACSTTPKSLTDEIDTIIPGEQQIRPGTATTPAIKHLIENARQASKRGRMSQADSFLERAIRIEPNNPLLWHYLAKLQLYQGHYQRAEGLAAKSSSLVQNSDRVSLLADNWRIIAHARQFQGNTAGAQQAQSRASELSNGNH